jgi:hypothetical protein
MKNLIFILFVFALFCSCQKDKYENISTELYSRPVDTTLVYILPPGIIKDTMPKGYGL